jgi:subtilisin family serine protease
MLQRAVQFPRIRGVSIVSIRRGGLDNLDDSYTYLRDGSNVDVYIIDSGMFIENGDFEGRASFGPDYGREIRTTTHGTHVAGTFFTFLFLPSFVVRLGLKITTSPILDACVSSSIFRFRNCGGA